jgi:hypothetical protein
MQRQKRSTDHKPRSVPWPVPDQPDAVAVDTTWGEMQRLQAAPGVVTGPQSPDALSQLVDVGHSAEALAYYRGGMHDWVTLGMPTEPRAD